MTGISPTRPTSKPNRSIAQWLNTVVVQHYDLRAGGSARVRTDRWTRFAFPTWWHYDVLRGLEYLVSAGVTPDERVAEAIDLVAAKRDDDGKWPLETRYRGMMPVEVDEVEIDEGDRRPSRWNTLCALRVLDWHSARV